MLCHLRTVWVINAWVVFIKTASDREEWLCFKPLDSRMWSHTCRVATTATSHDSDPFRRATAAEVLLYWSRTLLAGKRILRVWLRYWIRLSAQGAQLLPQTQCAHSVPKSFKCILRLFQKQSCLFRASARAMQPHWALALLITIHRKDQKSFLCTAAIYLLLFADDYWCTNGTKYYMCFGFISKMKYSCIWALSMVCRLIDVFTHLDWLWNSWQCFPLWGGFPCCISRTVWTYAGRPCPDAGHLRTCPRETGQSYCPGRPKSLLSYSSQMQHIGNRLTLAETDTRKSYLELSFACWDLKKSNSKRYTVQKDAVQNYPRQTLKRCQNNPDWKDCA